ncbi:hypothetical protein ACQR0Z_17405 [Bradyrhizobium sp. HKCCYLS3077]|uniref:hypothetical protein n=1 Tax=Bradyrhizobium sp. HKCCYLS3077 TaxID=3420761 RepID=UPI003EBD45D4
MMMGLLNFNTILGGSGGSNPVVTFRTGAASTGSGATQTLNVTLPGDGNQQFCILALFGGVLQQAISSVTVAPNVGSTVTLTRNVIDAQTRAAIYSGALLSDANSATSAVVTINYTANPFGNTQMAFYTAPLANLNSTTPTTTSQVGSTVTSISSTLATSAGGFIVTASFSGSNETTVATSGTETFTPGYNVPTVIPGDSSYANGISTNAASNVSFTVSPTATNIRMVAAAWR